jgi:hypothetical protein
MTIPTPQAFFGQMVETVAGQAFATAGYKLQDNPIHQMRGLFRYRKALDDGLSAYIEFQLLYYQGGRSRFHVNLLRNTGVDARANPNDPASIDVSLATLLWEDFGVRQLSSADHWWQFSSPQELGHAIAEAGKLVFGFGIPWLEGTLTPRDES